MSSTWSISVVARILLRQICRGDLPVGRLLPDEAVLAPTLGVSENAVRQALCELNAAGILTDGPGSAHKIAPRGQWRIPGPKPTRRSRAVARSIHDMMHSRILSPGELLTHDNLAKRVKVRCDRRDIDDALIELAASGLASPRPGAAGFLVGDPKRQR
ncbi:GntR family transcriptional regulator [Streptomyces xanthochromogenes]|uniref:GntR family transcriptional regulator n=1 Tax=Streptomyces xanthochromogenes TaxID=67384 RepID=UPI003806B92E